MRRAILTLVSTALLAGCGGSATTATSDTPSSSAATSGTLAAEPTADDVALRDAATAVTTAQNAILTIIVNCADSQQTSLIEASCARPIVDKGEAAKGSMLTMLDHAASTSPDSPCAAVAHEIVVWASAFPEAVDALVGDAITGELADGYDRYRSSANQWAKNMDAVIACSSGA